MSLATNGRAQPSKACEMGCPSNGWRSAEWPPMVQIGRASQPNGESVSQIVRYGYAPDVTAPRGMVCGHRPITEREVNCVV
jgi:hypothetical protein